MSRGFILVEASIAYVILAVALTALVPVFIVALRANRQAQNTQVATDLSRELIEEVRMRRWDEATPLTPIYISTPTASIGVDAGETASDKRTFDDIDDFNGWSEAAVLDPVMRPVAGLGGYSRSVTVGYVTAALAASGTPTDFKQISVCTLHAGHSPVCLSSVRVNR